MTGYALGRSSRMELIGVHPGLVARVKTGINITLQDFSVHDGLRTLPEQEEYVARGVSKTLNSYHLPQKDGYGHAVDLVPYINGRLRWEWPPIYVIANAMHVACEGTGLLLRWGAVWDRVFNDLNPDHLEEAVAAYAARRKSLGKKVFLDGPHFEVYSSQHHKWGRIKRT